MNFDIACDRILKVEGGYVNDPNDPGGETNFGITWPILRRAIADGIVPQNAVISSLTREQAKACYLRYFWQDGNMDQFDPDITYQLFDLAVNSGPGNAHKILQRAVRVNDDGNIGPVTIAAVKAMKVTTVLLRVLAARLRFLAALHVFTHDGPGLANRVADEMDYAADDSDED